MSVLLRISVVVGLAAVLACLPACGKKDDPAPAPKDNPDGLLFRIKDGSKLTSDPAGSKGTILYDPKTHRIESAEINITLKGDLAGMLSAARDSKRSPSDDDLVQIMLVAGARNKLYRQLCWAAA